MVGHTREEWCRIQAHCDGNPDFNLTYLKTDTVTKVEEPEAKPEMDEHDEPALNSEHEEDDDWKLTRMKILMRLRIQSLRCIAVSANMQIQVPADAAGDEKFPVCCGSLTHGPASPLPPQQLDSAARAFPSEEQAGGAAGNATAASSQEGA